MSKTHAIPEIYNPKIPHKVKCEIIAGLCNAMAKDKGINSDEMRTYFIERLNVDYENLDCNVVGMLLLYEYLYSQRPSACRLRN